MKRTTSKRPTIAAALIVKDEEAVLERCLNSIKSVVDEIVVVDTGSTDRTVEIASQFGARTFEFGWIDDFSAARNYALDQVTSDWVLQIDADEELASEDVNGLKEIAYHSKDDLHGLLIMDIANAEVRYFPRLFRNLPGIRYKNRVHEYIDINALKPDAVYTHVPVKIYHFGYQKELVIERGKLERNYQLALEALEDDPDNVEMIFELARHQSMQKDFEAAVSSYRRVISDGKNRTFTALSYKKLLEQLSLLGKFEEAMDEGILAIKAFPEFTDLFFLTGLNCLRANKPRKALKFFEDCLRLGETSNEFEKIPGAGSVLALLFCGYCLQTIREEGRAQELFTRALSMLRKDPMALVYLAKVIGQTEGRDQALAKIRSLADLNDPNVRSFLKVNFPEIE